MKVKQTFLGTFHRTHLSGTEQRISLVDLMREVQAVATQHYGRSPALLRQSFGLDFLPQPVLISALKLANAVATVGELYEVRSSQLLHRISSNLTGQQASTYSYQFITAEFTLNLTPDDPQLPATWSEDNLSQDRIYEIYLDNPHYPGLSNDLVNQIWQQANQQWLAMPATEIIHKNLHSIDSTCFRIIKEPTAEIWLELQDLSIECREAIAFLRQQQSIREPGVSTLSEPANSLIQQYRAEYNIPANRNRQLEHLAIDETTRANSGLVIGRSDRTNRFALEYIITNAQQFLLVSSYIIEDESITQLICQKSQDLSPGVWILTDLRDEVVDCLDVQVADNTKRSEVYRRSDELKKVCLQMLLDANIPIRSGASHLKAIISEQAAYLGSCNLTPGSLSRNNEAGIVFNQNSTLKKLLNLFRNFWQQRSRDDVIPDSNLRRFELRSVQRYHSSTNYEHWQSDSLLTPRHYQQDLMEQLRNFRGEVQIYSRSFHPDLEITELLDSPLIKVKLFVDSAFPPNVRLKNLIIELIPNLHAKVTVIGEQVAYIGGVNFNFKFKALSLADVMYKLTDAKSIAQIRQTLSTCT